MKLRDIITPDLINNIDIIKVLWSNDSQDIITRFYLTSNLFILDCGGTYDIKLSLDTNIEMQRKNTFSCREYIYENKIQLSLFVLRSFEIMPFELT